MASIVYSNRVLTDGRIDRSALGLVAAMAGIDLELVEACVETLLETRLYDSISPQGQAGDGWWVHDYLDYQLSREEILRRRAVAEEEAEENDEALEAAKGETARPPGGKEVRRGKRKSRAKPNAMSAAEAGRLGWAARQAKGRSQQEADAEIGIDLQEPAGKVRGDLVSTTGVEAGEARSKEGAEPMTATVKPEAMAGGEPEARDAKPEAIAASEPEAAHAKPEAIVGKPEARADGKPEARDAKPEAIAASEPEATRGKPEAAMAKPESMAGGKPEAMGAKPEATVTKPEATVTKLEATVTKPEATVGKPEATVAKPEAMAGGKPEAMAGGKPEAGREAARGTLGAPPQSPPLPDPSPDRILNPIPEPDPEQQQQGALRLPGGVAERPGSVGQQAGADEAEEFARACQVAEMAGISSDTAMAREETARLWALCDREAGFWEAAVRQCAKYGSRKLAYLSSVIETNVAAGTWPGQRRTLRPTYGAMAGSGSGERKMRAEPADPGFARAYEQVRQAGIGSGSETERMFIHSLWKECAGVDQAVFFAAAVEDCVAHGGKTYAYLEKVIQSNLERDTWPGWKGRARAGAAEEWWTPDGIAAHWGVPAVEPELAAEAVIA
jgi:hypothetical protein